MAMSHAHLVLFILSKQQRGLPLTPAEQRVLDRYQQTQEAARRHARLVARSPSSPPHPSPGSAPLSPAGAEDAVFDGMSVSHAEYGTRLAQKGLTMPIGAEDRLSPPRPPRSPTLVAGERQRETEVAAQHAARAEALAAGAIDGRTAPAVQATARYKALGIELPVGIVLRDAGKPLPPPNYPVNGWRGR